MIKNYMETAVEFLLPTVLDEYKDICRCRKCMEDIKAIALNNLKPMYVATRKGSIYAKINEMDAQFKTDVIKEIVNAINVVSKNPRHVV